MGIAKNVQPFDGGGNGLNNINERALMAGINLTIDGDNSNGTTITLRILSIENHPN